MMGPALCAAAPEQTASISSEMTHDVSLRTFMRPPKPPLRLRHSIIGRPMPVGRAAAGASALLNQFAQQHSELLGLRFAQLLAEVLVHRPRIVRPCRLA